MEELPSQPGAPRRLRCEYRSDALAIDERRPRLSWWPNDHRPAELQTAYHIVAASHPDLLDMNEGDLWDSGRVESRESHQVAYQGKPLISGRRVWWKVRCYDSDGIASPWSEPAYFEAGLLAVDDWQGRWLSAGLHGSRIAPVPLPLFGRCFELPADVRQARIYVAARGQVALQLNGTELLEGCLAPCWVDYEQGVEYLTLDVSSLLRAGPNTLGLVLADGWFAGDPGTGYRQQYGQRPAFLVQLNAVLVDGQHYALFSDDRFRWQPSWILAADPSRGEQWDAIRYRQDWLAGGVHGDDWYPVLVGPSPEREGLRPAAAALIPTADQQPVPGRLRRWDAARCQALFEFPQPVLGRACLLARVPDGGAVRVRYGLKLDERGELEPLGEDACVAAGNEAGEQLQARFSLHGFRFAEVGGDVFSEDAIRALAVRICQPVQPAARLVTDHEDTNRLFDALLERLALTRQGVDFAGLAPFERMGIVARTGPVKGSELLLLDAAPLVVRWLDNMALAQFPEGGFPAVVPMLPVEETLCAEGPAGASAAFVEVLWQAYQHLADRRLLRTHYRSAKQLLSGSLMACRELIREDLDSPGDVPADLAATAWLYRTARLTARIAGILGHLGDLEDCEEIAGQVKGAFRRRFVTPDGRLVGDSPAAYALVLRLGLLDRTEIIRARQVLIDRVDAVLAQDVAARARLLETPWLLSVLTEQGRLDLAYRLALSAAPAEPDLDALLTAGVAQWLFSSLSGLAPSRDPSSDRVAFRHAIIQPRPPLGLGFGVADEPPLRAVEATLDTASGRYESSWTVSEEALVCRVRVPPNTTAELVLPDGVRHELDAGDHEHRMRFGEAGDGIPVLKEVS